MKSLKPRRGSHALQNRPLAVLAISAATGFLFVTASVNAEGDDLRPSGGDVSSLLNERNHRVTDRQAQARTLQQEIETLTGGVSTGVISELNEESEELLDANAMTPAEGPGVQVVLTDAPASAAKEGVDRRVLVVHEQDLRGFVNALWAGGAKAVSLQGQRLVTTTGIKCVGNTVLLEGRTYSPPFRIKAIGDPATMIDKINTLPETVTYAQYNKKFNLGMEVTTLADTKIPAYDGTVALEYASADRTNQ